MKYRFNNTALDATNYRLLVDGAEVAVEPQVFNLILYLIENKDRVISRDELLDHVWQGRVVSDTSINNSIKSARKALGDDGSKQHVIKTIHSRGYQFVAEFTNPNNPTSEKQNGQTKNSQVKIKVVAMSFLVLFLIAVSGYFIHQPDFKANPEEPEIYHIAVLPFFNNSPDSDTDYYDFAIADQVIGGLNYLKNIAVRPAASIRKYAAIDYNPIEAGKELGVDYILNGHYTIDDVDNTNGLGIKQGNNDSSIRLTAELVAINNNQIVWRGRPIVTSYNNTFKLQDLVVRQVVEGLKIEFATDKLDSIQQNIPQNPLAYEYYLRGIAYPYSTEGHRMAVAMLKQSIALDDQYAPTYIELGNRTQIAVPHP